MSKHLCHHHVPFRFRSAAVGFRPILAGIILVLMLVAVPAEISKETLSNGLEVAVESNPNSRVFAVHVLLRNRSAMEPAGKAGLVDLCHRLLTEGTRDLDKAALSLALDAIGAEVKAVDLSYIPFDDYYTVNEFSYVRFKTIDTFHVRGLELLSQMLFQPALTPAGFDEALGALKRVQTQRSTSPSVRSERALLAMFFPGTWEAEPVYGTADSLASLSLADVKSFWGTYFTPANMIITVETNLPPATVMTELKRIFGGGDKARPTARRDLPLPEKAPAVARVETIGLGGRQSYIRAGALVRPAEKDRLPLEVLLSMFSDAMAFQLREKEGLAYSIGAGVDSLNDGSAMLLEAYMGTRPENLTRAREGMQKQMVLFRQRKITAGELKKAVNRLRGRTLMRWIPSLNRCYYVGLCLFHGDPPACYRTRYAELSDITLDDLQRVQARYFNPDAFQWVLVK